MQGEVQVGGRIQLHDLRLCEGQIEILLTYNEKKSHILRRSAPEEIEVNGFLCSITISPITVHAVT